MMQDRITRGTLAGLLAGLWIVLVNLSSYHLFHFAKARWTDMLSQLVFGRPVKTPLDFAFGLFCFFIFVGTMGAVYARLILPKPGTGSYYFRAVGWGLFVWVFTLSLGTAYRIPQMWVIAPETGLTNIVSLVGWGLLLAFIMERWDRIYGE